MRLTPSSMARRNTRIASSSFFGGPQIPRPVRRIAPKPSRRTFRSPPIVKVPSGNSMMKTPVAEGLYFQATAAGRGDRGRIFLVHLHFRGGEECGFARGLDIELRYEAFVQRT